MNEDSGGAQEIFGFFNEIAIVNQLSTAMLANSLPAGVHPSHFSIVNHLVRMGDGKPPLRIAMAMQVSKNTMSHSLKVLQDRGYISVQPDPEDGRGKRVYLTDAGRAFREEAVAQVTAALEPVIDDAQLALMRRMREDLARLREHLDRNR